MFVKPMPLLAGRTVLITVAKLDDKIKSILLMGQFPEWAFAAKRITCNYAVRRGHIGKPWAIMASNL
jgi:hypothetical protein